jgi:hypothetical protein
MKKFLVTMFALVAFLASSFAPALAQEPTEPPTRIDGVTATLTAVPAADGAFTVGDEIVLELLVSHPTGYRLIPADLTQQWANVDLEVGEQSPVTITDNGDGTQMSRQTITLTPWTTGIMTLPPLTFSLSDAQGNLQTVRSDPAVFEVASVLVEGEMTLRDIKPQAMLPFPAVWPQATAVAVVLLLIAASAIAFVLWRRNRPQPDTRPAFQRALDELTRIEKMNLVGQGLGQAHVTLVTDVLRRYLEADFGIPALDQTTTQIVAALGQEAAQTMPLEAKEPMIQLLREADLVKFANIEPDPTTAVSMSAEIRAIILAIRPAPLLENEDNKTTSPTMTTTEATA